MTVAEQDRTVRSGSLGAHSRWPRFVDVAANLMDEAAARARRTRN